MRVSPLGFMKANYLLTVAAAVMLSACSNSVERFAENPSNADPVYTASVPKFKKPVTAYKAPAYEENSDDNISSRPLASAPLKQPKYSYETAYKKPAYKQPQVAYNKPKYKAPVYEAPEQEPAYNDEPAPATTAPVYKKQSYTNAPALAPQAAPAKNGSVRVGDGMTLYSIAKANGLTVAQLANANGIEAPYSVSSGRVLKIPGRAVAELPETKYRPKAATLAEADEVEITPKLAKAKAAGSHTVASGETLFSLGRKYNVSPYAIASLNGLSNDTALGVGQAVRIPGGGSAPVVAMSKPLPKRLAAPIDENVVDESNTDSEAAIGEEPVTATAAPKKIPMVKQLPVEVAQAPALGNMRWPVKGKIISEFGTKPNGLKNEGINLAVPEGTGVRAAENGIVAYAGNQLKGYGNLVLIRHDGGYVTAYAHAKELFVKKGDTVKRGDVIAKAGQTGSVSSPQLHFEVRKGATAMDPLKFLSSQTASN